MGRRSCTCPYCNGDSAMRKLIDRYVETLRRTDPRWIAEARGFIEDNSESMFEYKPLPDSVLREHAYLLNEVKP